jgi:hypothetical protein
MTDKSNADHSPASPMLECVDEENSSSDSENELFVPGKILNFSQEGIKVPQRCDSPGQVKHDLILG